MAPDGLTTSVVSHIFALIGKDAAHSYAVSQIKSMLFSFRPFWQKYTVGSKRMLLRLTFSRYIYSRYCWITNHTKSFRFSLSNQNPVTQLGVMTSPLRSKCSLDCSSEKEHNQVRLLQGSPSHWTNVNLSQTLGQWGRSKKLACERKTPEPGTGKTKVCSIPYL